MAVTTTPETGNSPCDPAQHREDVDAAPRVVVDTNVLLDIVVFDDPRSHALRAAIDSRAVRCLRSADTEAEFAEVLARPRFKLDERRRTGALDWWRASSSPVERVFAAPWACTDPLDQKFLDLAASADARVLVTKDRALLKLARRTRRDALAITLPENVPALLAASA